jgi:uncharacterized protein YkwD
MTLLASTARAEVRYGEAGAGAQASGLSARLEALVDEVAHAERREPPRPDARLRRAAEALALVTPPDGRPSNEQVQAALWSNGIVEPPPHLILAGMSPGGESGLTAELKAQLPRALSTGRYKRVGAAAPEIDGPHGKEIMVVIALLESSITVEPIARTMPPGGHASLRGELAAPFERPEAFVTAPDGKVARLSLTGDARRFATIFRCAGLGRHQVEINGDDRFGATVLANFPVYCGAAAPVGVPRIAADEQAPPDAASAEKRLYDLVDADRRKAGLAPLERDDRLAKIARGHSADMAAHGFVGHISPTTGSAADRIKAAKLDAALVLENVARAYTAEEAERGLMDSPGHRANLLNPNPTRLGIGVAALEAGGQREILVTQLFLRPPDRVGAQSAGDVRRRVEELRRAHSLPGFAADPLLDDAAQKTAEEVARGEKRTALDAALHKLGAYASVRSVVAQGATVASIVDGMEKALLDGTATAAGIGLAAGGPGVIAVIVLGVRR